uniref:P-type domain-containing protein n=1 Tax=Micromonas pusilla TaxID=38833 RepID=A0A7S0GQ75_MICPS|mmetsp:Transcript_11249/g.48006  ORF Transcript_11249/g.48006 Transcript_11249/m.48006 type:complete len:971 (+) Transcript_11249:276-3188(+)
MAKASQKILVTFFACTGLAYTLYVLAQTCEVLTSNKVPRIVHFVFGFADDGAESEFGLLQFCAVKAAHDRLRPEKILMHVLHVPKGFWWEQAVPYLKLENIDDVYTMGGKPVDKFAHKADLVRLAALQMYGGIYIDLDVWVLRSFDDLLSEEFVLGEEGPASSVGLSNAVIVAKKNSRFLSRWLNSYVTFDPEKWNVHSIVLPRNLSRDHPDEITVLPHIHFAWPLWDGHGITNLYIDHSCASLNSSFAVHLWSSKVRAYHNGLTYDSLWSHETCFTRMARDILLGGKPFELANKAHKLQTADILLCIPVDDLQASVILASSWVAHARSLGFRVVFFTSNVILVHDEFVTLLGDIRLLQQPRDTPDHDEKAEWKTFAMLKVLSSDFIGYKWYVKIDADTLLRSEKLRHMLASYNPDKPYLLGSTQRFIGFLGTYLNPEVETFQHITYPMGNMYAMSSQLVTEIAPHATECLHSTPHEDKSIAKCAQKYSGCGVTNFGATRYGRKSTFDRNDRDVAAGFHRSNSETVLQDFRYLLPEISPAGISDDGYVTLDTPCGTGVFFPRYFDERGVPAYRDQFCGHVMGKPRLSDPADFRTHAPLTSPNPALDQGMCFYTARECGSLEGNISRTACIRAGCCYDQTREVRCFAKFGPIAVLGSNSSIIAGNCPDASRQNVGEFMCGRTGISTRECLMLGCCYDAEMHSCYRRGSFEFTAVKFPISLDAAREYFDDLLGERALPIPFARWCEELTMNTTGSDRTFRLRVSLSTDGLCVSEATLRADNWIISANPRELTEVFIELDGLAQNFVSSNSAFFDTLAGCNTYLVYDREALDKTGPLPAADFVLYEFYERGYIIRLENDGEALSTGDQLRETLDGKTVEVLQMYRHPPYSLLWESTRKPAPVSVFSWFLCALFLLRSSCIYIKERRKTRCFKLFRIKRSRGSEVNRPQKDPEGIFDMVKTCSRLRELLKKQPM